MEATTTHKMMNLCGIFFLTIILVGAIYTSSITLNRPNTLELNSSITLHQSSTPPTLLWNTTWGGYATDYPNGLTVDATGNIYCVGRTESSGAGSADLALVKFASNGTKLWNVTWGSIDGDMGHGVVTDASGAIYCVGDTDLIDPSDDMLLIKFFPNGTKAWNVTWGQIGPQEWGRELVLDATGNIYCVGYTFGQDLHLVKFDSNGNEEWNVTWGGANFERGNDIAIDASGAIYCVGDTESFGLGTIDNGDLALVKFASNKTKLWNVTWGGPGPEYSEAIALDAAGNIYCVGETNITDPNYDMMLIKFDYNGDEQWNFTWGGIGYEVCMDVAVDPMGAIYCVGYSESFDPDGDLLLLKVNSSGALEWNLTWGGEGEEDGCGIALDAAGNVYCTGLTDSFGALSADFSLLKFLEPPEPPILEQISPSTSTNGRVQLNWNDVYRATEYYVYRDTSNITSLGGLTSIINVTESNYTDVITNNGIYYYIIVAGNSVGNSSISNCKSVVVAIPPAIPNIPVLDPISPSTDTDGSIDLTWNDVAGATTYYVYRETSNITSVNGKTPIDAIFTSNYTDTITDNGIYYYVIVAGNSTGNSSISNCESVTVDIPKNGIPGFELPLLLLALSTLLTLKLGRKSLKKPQLK